jgi:hypothetical protein
MWQFPALEAVGTDSRLAIAAYLKEKFQLATNGNLLPLATARHTVTFRNIRLEPYLVRVARLPRITDTSIVDLAEVPSMSISNATRKIADVAIAHAALPLAPNEGRSSWHRLQPVGVGPSKDKKPRG